mmetsp:Transcript_30909/g.91873  ORF Transcript_30909/g.91873 Transcript_30909/m.91873 type:complete len:499 (-) Transcript_30909:113-1609(-)|eukprot:CAMPEP_0175231376 /NCGR_PEP_ID=MMETSP0093-20121207/25425_1 /TAXON_ID=311494 /ORGANISM="Alexandrium monilatum, Strain CCMP3105" /LENGTH=498 /DNA_ID=CAMNT_0016525227 /DNA_START=49 /DNA_END=1545 /DNA_ORIENTATION=+
MALDQTVRVGKTIVALLKEVERGNGEVPKLCREAEQCFSQNQADKGFKTALEALSSLVHAKAAEMMTLGSSLSKDAINRAEVLAKEVARMCQESSDKAGEALALSAIADVYILSSETSKGLKTAHASASLYRRLDDKPGEARVLNSVTTAHLLKVNAGFNPQLEMADRADEKMEQMRLQREVETESAMEAAKEIVTLQRAMGDRKGEAKALDKVAEIHLMREEAEQSKAVAREERSLYQEIRDVRGEAAALQTIINANLQDADDFDDALIAAKDMVKLFRGRDRKTDDEDKKGTADALQALAKVLSAKMDMAEALESGEEAMKLYSEIGDKKDSALCCHTLAQIHIAMEKPKEAIKCARQAVADYRDSGDRLAEANALHDLAVLDMDDLLTEVEKDPKSFSKEHSERLSAGWGPLEDALAIYRDLKHGEGEYYVSETINNVIERSRQIHIRVAEPIKTIYISDPNTRQSSALHIFDTSIFDGLPEDDDQGALELGDGE